jgi:hypothetical protein
MKKLLIFMAVMGLSVPAWGAWDLSKSSIDVDQIRSGGPPRDGIPALFDPEYITAEKANDFLSPHERVLGFSLGGEARAYPIRIMSWHELVNDTVKGSPILASW